MLLTDEETGMLNGDKGPAVKKAMDEIRKGLPPDVKAALNQGVVAALNDPQMRQRLTGTMALGSSHRILGLGGPDLIASFSPIPARHRALVCSFGRNAHRHLL